MGAAVIGWVSASVIGTIEVRSLVARGVSHRVLVVSKVARYGVPMSLWCCSTLGRGAIVLAAMLTTTVLGCRASVERMGGGRTSGALEPATAPATEPVLELAPERPSEGASQPTPAPSTPREVVQTHVIRVEPRGAEATANRDTNGREIAAVVSTLAEAIAQVERARADGSKDYWTISLAAGLYEMRRGVVISAELGPLSIEADAPGATLVGAIVIPEAAWQAPDTALSKALLERIPAEARGGVRVATLDAATLGGWAGGLSGPVHSGHAVEVTAGRSELFLGDQALELARWPNDGFAKIGAIIDRGSAPRESESDMPASERRIEPPRAGAFRPVERERVARWTGSEDAWAHGYWNWDWSDELLPIASIDENEAVVRLGMPHRYGLAARGHFRVTNVLGELDEPGEYWVDRAGGRIVAWIPDETRGETLSLSLLAEPFLRLDGASDVRIAGITFERTRGGAIAAEGVARVTIEQCAFRNLGTFAVDAQGTEIHVARGRFEDVGGRGVRLRGGDRATLSPSGSVIEDCVFLGCGRVLRSYNPAIDLEGVGHRVRHNEIAQHPHIAIFMRGNDHVIEANDIHDVVLETGDAGAVYCGRDWTSHGNVIRGNAFSAIRGSDARFQNAVYLDDMASGFLVEENLFVACNWGILAGGGRDNTIRANIFACCGRAVSYDARGIGWMAPHIADPSTSTLHRNLAAMPIASEPWRARFPTLGTYLTDRFGRPVGSSIAQSVLIDTPFGRVDDPECVRVEGTVTLPVERDVLGAAAESECARLLRGVRTDAVERAGVKVGPVGPRR
jgi:hypothetical protein